MPPQSMTVEVRMKLARRPGKGARRISNRRVVEAQASWISSLILFFSTVYMVLEFDFLWTVFGITALSLYILPIVTLRDPFKALPWEMTVLLAAPLLLRISEGSQLLSEELRWWDDLTSLAFAFSLSTIGFLLTIELHMYTDVRMNRPMSAFFVVMFTLSASGFWFLWEYLSDELLGTTHLTSNETVMRNLFWILVGGLIMGFLYAAYLKAMSGERRRTFGLIHLWEVGD